MTASVAIALQGLVKEKVRGATVPPLTCGVSDGTRTRDIQDHNLTLYQLNYTHHGRAGPECLRA